MRSGLDKRQQYRELERSLEQRFRKEKENEVSLDREDFKDGKLTYFGFSRLKQQCEHISIREEIEITAPEEYADGLRDTLERMGAAELSLLKKERSATAAKSLALFLGGVFFIMMGFLFETWDVPGIFRQIIAIASWVFVWAAVEKFFFDRTRLQAGRLRLLQILSARITAQPASPAASATVPTE